MNTLLDYINFFWNEVYVISNHVMLVEMQVFTMIEYFTDVFW